MTSARDGDNANTTARTEGKVQGLRREVPDDVGGVSTPEGNETLVTVSPREAV